ncbi:ABC-type tungstate transport system, periplasmic component, TupA [Thermogladius calderae 1633]|uniref:ABC-type tungstate transport system, periplasmic component, TupA n=1 Tax=Thermogladius calderae (strain DSM 22663 / VKM B-2946 / 1633) TaxID=1184251 RepID=I3TER8_THEC1|nr:ABC transporter permease [Thermogladius calderae]AFK51256.1 ABC-type tungstate transport system, periplasmic component, TupA [Thermogladius calderae 1633]
MESLLDITLRSLWISGLASLVSFMGALALSFSLARTRESVGNVVAGFIESLVGVPTTVIGLLTYMLLYPKGPLAPLKLLYTPWAIVIGESLVALPVSTVVLYRSVKRSLSVVGELAASLGLTGGDLLGLVAREVIPDLFTSYLVGFSRAIGELGVALIAGGGIQGYTNVLTTAIALETSIGNYEDAISVGLVLISITALITLALKAVGEKLWRSF